MITYDLTFLFYLQLMVYCDNNIGDILPLPNRKVTIEQYIKQNNLSSPEECARTCDESKRRCYYNFYLEQYATQTSACDYCLPNRVNNCQCIPADGIARSVITANRVIPGPSIEVCEGDEVIVDVENHLEGADATIHWHGLHHTGSQYYDGVPYVTQCPILQGNTFRYIWTAAHAGTHYWHAHTGFQKMDGLAGSIIVRQFLAKDLNSKLYDYDLSEHVMFVQDWIHELAGNRYPGCIVADETHSRPRCASVSQIPDNILVNGKGLYKGPKPKSYLTNLETFKVVTGRRYRFRLIGAISLACPIRITVQNHTLNLIASDGESINPVYIDQIILTSGERYDFIIYANNSPGNYRIEVNAIGICTDMGITQYATLEYLTEYGTTTTVPVSNSGEMKLHCSLEDAICISQLHSIKPIDVDILKPEPDVKLFLPFSFYTYEETELFQSNHFNNYFVPLGLDHKAGLINNISYVPSPSPLLTQFSELDPTHFCDNSNLELKCEGICRCTHLLRIPLNAVVELILIDELENKDLVHPFHLHGYSFYIFGSGRVSNSNESISLRKIIEMDKRKQIYSGNHSPPSKDTIAVPNNGYVVIRFKASNPGFWLFHCHFLNHLLTGMSVVLQVGSFSDLPPPPQNFPRCGNFLPDI